MNTKNLSFLLFFCFLLGSCVSADSKKEYVLAWSALSAAEKFEADKFYPKIYSKALLFYKRAVSLYRKKKYEEASNFFEKSIHFAEKAEFKARVKKNRESE